MFTLHPQLAADCFDLGKLSLCRVLLMNDARFPWLILVPEREAISEIYQLDHADQITLLNESSRVAGALSDQFNADKMNIAALGNMVPQLHLHHVVRYKTDACWPQPIWGQGEAAPYEPDQVDALISQLRTSLELNIDN